MKTPDPSQSGKRGHRVWQKARHGLISYPAFVPFNPRSPGQVAVRDIFRYLNARWSQITEAQRALWRAAARKHRSRPRLDQSGPLTGQQLFLKINIARLYYHLGCVDEPFAYPCFSRLAVSGLQITNIASRVEIALLCRGDPGDRTILRASRPRTADCKLCTDFRFIGFCPPPTDGQVDITAPYSAKFKLLLAGSRIFVRANQVIEGWEDAPCVFTAVVPPSA
jgi:hypothetical protein